MKLLLLFSALFIVSNTLYASRNFTVDLKTFEEDNWSKEELSAIKEATEFVFDHIHTYKVATCAYRNSYREPSKDKLRKKWGNQIPVLNKTDKVAISIKKKKLEKRVLGEAVVGTVAIDKKMYRIYNLEITLNGDQIHSHLSRDKNKKDLRGLWANVIAHEIAHNFGYRHGSRGSWSDDYPGYFVTELGYCVESMGKFGSKKK